MPVAAVLGDAIVSLDELDKLARKPSVEKFLAEDTFDPNFKVDMDDGRQVDATSLTRAWDAAAPTVPFEGIGWGKPLTIVLEKVYVGNYPDAVRWVPGDQPGDVLVTSANKGFEIFDAAPRAIHLMQARAKRRRPIRPRAVANGSALIYYSPSVTQDSMLFTLEMTVDREFDKALGDKLAQAFTAAGALPVFATAAPYLLAAGVAIPIAQEAVNLLARPRTFFEADLEFAFSRPGLPTWQNHILVLYPEGYEEGFPGFTMGANYTLRDRDGKAYAGDQPYAILTLDGTAQKEYEGWTAQAASAAITDRYFSGGGALTAAVEIVSKSLALYNDMEYRRRAAEAKAKAAKAKGDAKEKLLAELEAYKKNIANEEIRGTLD